MPDNQGAQAPNSPTQSSSSAGASQPQGSAQQAPKEGFLDKIKKLFGKK